MAASGEEAAQEWTKERELQWTKSIQAEEKDESVKKLHSWLLPKAAGFFVGPSKHRLHVRVAVPPEGGSVVGTVFLCHGLNTHTNRSDFKRRLMDKLSTKGFVVVAPDCMGHGHSEGLKGLVPDWQLVFSDYAALVEGVMGISALTPEAAEFCMPEKMLATVRERPVFTMGESMGGMIAMYLGLKLQEHGKLKPLFKGCVLGAPALQVDLPPAFVQTLLRKFVVPLVGKKIMPGFVSSSSDILRINVVNMSDDTTREDMAMEIRDDWNRFPDVALGWVGGMRWSTAASFSSLYSGIDDEMRKVAFPLLVQHDPDDVVCFIGGSKRLMELCQSEDKVLVETPGSKHGLWITSEECVGSAMEWMLTRAA